MKSIGKILEVRPEAAYSILALFFGILFVFIEPPFYVLDEVAHFYRSYQISDLGIIGEKGIYFDQHRGYHSGSGGYLPSSVVNTRKIINYTPYATTELSKKHGYLEGCIAQIDWQKIKRCLNLKLNPDVKEFVDFRNTVIYAPFSYLPQAIGISVGKILHLPPLAILYLARLFALLCSIMLIYYAIKLTPILKWEIFLLALMPKALYETASASYDSLTISLSLLFSALFLYYALVKKELALKDIAFIFVMAVLVAFSKLVYFMLIFLYFLIPHEKVGSWKKYLTIFFFLFFIGIFPALLWNALIAKLYLPIPWTLGVNPYQQFAIVLAHPLNFFAAILRSFKDFGMAYLLQFVGIDIAKLPEIAELPNILDFRYTLILLLVPFLGERDEPLLTIQQRGIIGISFILNVLVMCLLLYLSATTIGMDYVDGIQGRYFIPFAYLFFLLFQARFPLKISIATIKPLFLIAFSSATLMMVLSAIVSKYYS